MSFPLQQMSRVQSSKVVNVSILLIIDVSGLVLKAFHQLSPTVMHSLLSALRAFISAVEEIPLPLTHTTDQDSQDYGDATLFEEFVAAQDSTVEFPAGITLSSINTHLFQVIANIFANANPVPVDLPAIIDLWIFGNSALVKYHQYDWSTFLQYGGVWERLRSTNSRISRAWCPYILTKLLEADPNAYFEGQEHFISAWFESIVEPELERQHAYTSALLNISGDSWFLETSLFTKNAAGSYEISADALFEARPGLIVRMMPFLLI